MFDYLFDQRHDTPLDCPFHVDQITGAPCLCSRADPVGWHLEPRLAGLLGFFSPEEGKPVTEVPFDRIPVYQITEVH